MISKYSDRMYVLGKEQGVEGLHFVAVSSKARLCSWEKVDLCTKARRHCRTQQTYDVVPLEAQNQLEGRDQVNASFEMNADFWMKECRVHLLRDREEEGEYSIKQ
ncbi:unnamed protein product [Camellia sinensis]